MGFDIYPQVVTGTTPPSTYGQAFIEGSISGTGNVKTVNIPASNVYAISRSASPVSCNGGSLGSTFIATRYGTTCTLTSSATSITSNVLPATPTAIFDTGFVSSAITGFATNGSGTYIAARAAGSFTVIHRSTDSGTTWSSVSCYASSITTTLVAYDSALGFIAYAPAQIILSSATGAGGTWTQGSTTNVQTSPTSMAAGGGFVVMVNNSASIAYNTSGNGLGNSWLTSTPFAFSMNRIRYLNNTFVAWNRGASSSTFYTATNPNTWTNRTSPITIDHITYSNGTYIISSNSGSIALTTDFINYTTYTTGGVYADAVYTNNVFVSYLISGGTLTYTTTTGGTTTSALTNSPGSEYGSQAWFYRSATNDFIVGGTLTGGNAGIYRVTAETPVLSAYASPTTVA